MNGRCTRGARLLSVVMGLCLAGVPADAGTVVSTVAGTELNNSGSTLNVEMFVNHTGALDRLAVYQGRVEVSGGDAGSLDVIAAGIDHENPDWVFSSVPETNLIDCTGVFFFDSVCAAMINHAGVNVQNPGYIGAMIHFASADAEGIFEVVSAPEGEEGTLFIDALGPYVPFQLDDPAEVGVDIECFADRHCGGSTPFCKIFAPSPVYTCVECLKSADCDDENSCTTDACDKPGGYVCQHTNLSQGTSCDDGLFCTDVDECDANGTCVGTGDPCTQSPFIQCCEATDTCLDPNGLIQCQAGP